MCGNIWNLDICRCCWQPVSERLFSVLYNDNNHSAQSWQITYCPLNCGNVQWLYRSVVRLYNSVATCIFILASISHVAGGQRAWAYFPYDPPTCRTSESGLNGVVTKPAVCSLIDFAIENCCTFDHCVIVLFYLRWLLSLFIQQLCVYCVNFSDIGASNTGHIKGYLTWLEIVTRLKYKQNPYNGDFTFVNLPGGIWQIDPQPQLRMLFMLLLMLLMMRMMRRRMTLWCPRDVEHTLKSRE